jgi:hypothetical protein
MYFHRQPVATNGNGSGLFWPRLLRSDLSSIATGCNHGAPLRLHPTLPLLATAPGGMATVATAGLQKAPRRGNGRRKRYALGRRAFAFSPSLNVAA